MMQVTKVWWDGEKLMAEPIDPTTIYQEPAQRKPWVGLTEQEENELWESTDSDWELMKRTEAKLREKNGITGEQA